METWLVIASNVWVSIVTWWLVTNWPDITPFASRATWRIKADVVEDPEVNAAYIYMADRNVAHMAATTVPVFANILVDLDSDGRLIGIEFLDKKELPPKPGSKPAAPVDRTEVLQDYDVYDDDYDYDSSDDYDEEEEDDDGEQCGDGCDLVGNAHMEPLPNIHPGEILKKDFLEPNDLTIEKLAQDMYFDPTKLAEIVAGKRDITVSIAAKLGFVLKTTPELWIGLQRDFDKEEG